MTAKQIRAYAIAYAIGIASAAIPMFLFGLGFLIALADEAEIRARNSLMHQIGNYKPNPEECLIVDTRATCIVKFANGRDLVEFSVTKAPKQ